MYEKCGRLDVGHVLVHVHIMYTSCNLYIVTCTRTCRRTHHVHIMYFLLSDVNGAWDFYRAQIRVFEYAVIITRVQIMSAYFAAIITESGKICACAGTSSGRYRPRVGTQRYLPVLPSTCFNSHNIFRINLLNLRNYLEAKFNHMEVTSSEDPGPI